jgi:hypothetical protein
LTDRETVRALAVAAGLAIEGQRLEGLTAQAASYLPMIRSLDGLRAVAEPAAIFRLDEQEAGQ